MRVICLKKLALRSYNTAIVYEIHLFFIILNIINIKYRPLLQAVYNKK